MKKLNLITTTGAVSLLSLTLATGTYVAEKKPQTQGKDQKEQSNQEKKAADRPSDQLRKQSQASKIIGMNIANDQGQELGEVKAIALDLHTGKINYVVVGWGQKATLVPSFLFLPDPQGDKLRLQATIEQMRNAPGIQLSELPQIHSDHPKERKLPLSGSGVYRIVRSQHLFNGVLRLMIASKDKTQILPPFPVPIWRTPTERQHFSSGKELKIFCVSVSE